jgi:uncharacterized protein YjbI with pentapeptide repeats
MTPPKSKGPQTVMTVSDRPRPTDEELRAVLAQHRRWVESNGREGARADLSERDLSGLDLSGVNLASARLNGTNLNGSNLNGADLNGAYLVTASLARAELNLATLAGARLTDAYLVGAEMCRADLSGAYLERAHLQQANLDHADLGHADLSRADLAGANLTRTDLTRATLPRANLARADLRRANMTRAELDLADLARAHLAGADLKEARLNRANLAGADLRQADLSGAQLVGADLSQTLLRGARFANADLRAARVNRFDQAFVRGAQFSAMNPRWRAFVCEIVFAPLAGWLTRAGLDRAARQIAFTVDPNDPWSVLRQSYAGPRVLFLLFAVLLFAMPYLTRAAIYSTTAPIERQLVEQARHRKGQLEIRLAVTPNNRDLKEELARVNEMLMRFEPRPIWQVLLRLDEGVLWPSVLAGVLALYNVGVYVLITKVSALRDEEERSGWTPAWKDYRHLIWVHRVVVILFYVSVGSFVLNLAHMLGQEVLVPHFH